MFTKYIYRAVLVTAALTGGAISPKLAFAEKSGLISVTAGPEKQGSAWDAGGGIGSKAGVGAYFSLPTAPPDLKICIFNLASEQLSGCEGFPRAAKADCENTFQCDALDLVVALKDDFAIIVLDVDAAAHDFAGMIFVTSEKLDPRSEAFGEYRAAATNAALRAMGMESRPWQVQNVRSRRYRTYFREQLEEGVVDGDVEYRIEFF